MDPDFDPKYKEILAKLGLIPMTRDEIIADVTSRRNYLEGWGYDERNMRWLEPRPTYAPPERLLTQRDATEQAVRASTPKPFQLMQPAPMPTDAIQAPEGPGPFTQPKHSPPIQPQQTSGLGEKVKDALVAGAAGATGAAASAIATALGAGGSALTAAATGMVPLTRGTLDMFHHYLQPYHPYTVATSLLEKGRQIVLTPTELFLKLTPPLPQQMDVTSKDKLVSLLRGGYENILELPHLSVHSTTPQEYLGMATNVLDNIQQISPSQLFRIGQAFGLDSWEAASDALLRAIPLELAGALTSVGAHQGRHRAMGALQGLWDYIPTLIESSDFISPEMAGELAGLRDGSIGRFDPLQFSRSLAGEGAGKMSGAIRGVFDDVLNLSEREDYIPARHDLLQQMGLSTKVDFWNRDYLSRQELLDRFRPDLDWEAYRGNIGLIEGTTEELEQARAIYDRYRGVINQKDSMPPWLFDELYKIIPSIKGVMGEPGSSIPPGTMLPKLADELRRLMSDFERSSSGG